MRIRTILIAFVGAALLCLAVLAGWWHVLAGRAETIVAEWMQRLDRGGYSTAHAGLETGGFPTRVELTLREAAIGWRRGSDSGEIRLPVLSAAAPVWDPETIHFVSPGGVSASLVSAAGPLELSAASLEGTIRPASRTEAGRAWAVRGELADLKASGAEGASPMLAAQAAIVDLAMPEILLVSPDAEGIVKLTSRLEEIELPTPTSLGDRIRAVTLMSDVTAPLPGGWSAPALAAWRDRDGRVVLHQGGVDWGPLQLRGAGGLTLDRALRPEGSLQIRVRGYEPALDALARAGMLPSDQVSAIKLALGFISRQPEPGGPREAGAELDLDEGWLKLGPFRLAPLPPVVPQ